MHPGIHEYAEKLTAKLPGDLKVYPLAGNLAGIKFSVADFDLVVRYSIVMCIHAQRKYWRILIWQ